MPNLPFNASTLDQIVEELLFWFGSAETEDILTYYKALPSTGRDLPILVKAILIDRLRTQRIQGLQTLLNSNAAEVMNEPELLAFIANLSQYSSTSVIANYKKKYPQLVAEVSTTDLSSWALAITKTWKNAFYFLVTPRYVEYSLYLDSIIKTVKEPSELESLHSVVSNLLKETVDHIASQNYKATPFPADKKVRLQRQLDTISFLPPEYTSTLINNPSPESLYKLLSALDYILEILKTVSDKAGAWDEQSLKTLLYDQLAWEEETEAMKEFAAARIATITPAIEELAEWLDSICTVENIQSGNAATTILQYLGTISPTDKKEFLKLLKTYFLESSALAAMLEPLETKNIIEELEYAQGDAEKKTYIAEIQNQYSPEDWPFAQSALTFLSQLF